jgi:hypothetical protein
MPKRPEQFRDERATDEFSYQQTVQRGQCNGAIPQHFHCGASRAEADHRAEKRVRDHPYHQFAAIGLNHHRLDGDAVDSCIGTDFFHLLDNLVVGGTNRGGIHQV